MWRGRVEYPELRARAQRLAFDYRDTGKEPNKTFRGRGVDICLVEAKASGDPLIQDLHRAGVKATPFVPNKFGDKIARVRYTTPILESGRVWVRARSPDYTRLLPYCEEFVEAVAMFPQEEARDLVDTMTQALIKLRQGGFVRHPKDPVYYESEKTIPSIY